MITKNEIDISELGDFDGTLGEFKEIIDRLVVEYGQQSLISFDAGYNNVSVIVKTV